MSFHQVLLFIFTEGIDIEIYVYIFQALSALKKELGGINQLPNGIVQSMQVTQF